MLHESQLPRSCDRCHVNKERCRFAACASRCDRCTRLRLGCQISRPFKMPGRPRAPPHDGRLHDERTPASDTDAAAVAFSSSLERRVTINGDLTGRELRLLDTVLFHRPFMENFILGPSFCESHSQHLVSHFLASKPTLKDALLALGLLWDHEPCRPTDGFRKASAALSTLRLFQVRDMDDVSVCLVLGATVLAFVLKLGASSALSVSSYTLNLVQPVYNSARLVRSQDLGFLNCLVYTEIVECLLSTNAPTLRSNPAGATTYVDRFVGLCTPLLPHLYDLCQLSCALLHDSRSNGAKALYIRRSLDGLELAVRSWRPRVPEEATTQLTATEVAHVVCQAQVMQTAALLIIHRLRYPFGSEVATASELASSILAQLDLTSLSTGSAPRCVDFPLIVACLELQHGSEMEQWLQSISPIGDYSTPFYERVKAIITAVWAARRRSTNLYWYHLGSIAASTEIYGS